jgi:hypothetical protein
MSADIQPKAALPASLHQPFSVLSDKARQITMAEFVAITLDLALGMQTCLEIVHAANFQRIYNEESEAGEEVAPAISEYGAEVLLRFSIAAAKLLHESADGSITWMNNYGWFFKGPADL